MRRIWPGGLRSRLTIVVVAGAALTLSALTAGFNLALAQSLNGDANEVLRARASAVLGTLGATDGRLRAGEAPDDAAVDSQVWVYAGTGAIERPSASPLDQRLADSLAGSPRRFAEQPETDTRLYAVPIVHAGQRAGTLVTGVSLEPYERTTHRAFIASLLFAALVLVALAISTRWVIAGALRPVARMTAEAADWSERDLDHRFASGEPRDELTTLAATFDQLLDRVAASLRHEQRFSAELSHELRTPLASVIAECELALLRDRDGDAYRATLRAVMKRAGQMQRTLEVLMAAARAESGLRRGTSDAEQIAIQASDACRSLADERRVQIEVVSPSTPVRVGADPDIAERVLAPLVENGCRYGRSSVRIEVQRSDEDVRFLVQDDGPGVRVGDRERIFEAGVRGPNGAASVTADGAGLGLALARRLARAVDGEVEHVPSDSETVFRARLPPG